MKQMMKKEESENVTKIKMCEEGKNVWYVLKWDKTILKYTPPQKYNFFEKNVTGSYLQVERL